MTQICAGALGAGFLIAFILPFLPFAGSVVFAVVLGASFSLLVGRSIGDTLMPAFCILVACQVGYGLGLVAAAFGGRVLRSHRRWRQVNDATLVKRLRSERK